MEILNTGTVPQSRQGSCTSSSLRHSGSLATAASVLQGFAGPRARKDIVQRFPALLLLVPDRQDHIDAAEIRNICRRAGVQIGTIDALLARWRTGTAPCDHSCPAASLI